MAHEVESTRARLAAHYRPPSTSSSLTSPSRGAQDATWEE
jgi:hypothetical protein